MITIDEFKKVELKTAKVISAERVEGSEKLLKLQVSLGTEERQILSGIGKWYQPEEMVGKTVIVATNLEPRSMMGLESQGMVLAADGGDKPILLTTSEDCPPGSSIR